MKIVRFDKEGNCQFVYFDWHELKFKTTCWSKSIDALFGATKDRKHLIIGLWNF